jgi:hypothetical protein
MMSQHRLSQDKHEEKSESNTRKNRKANKRPHQLNDHVRVDLPQRWCPFQRCIVGDCLDAHVRVRRRKLGSDLVNHLEKRGRLCAAGIAQDIVGWAARLSNTHLCYQWICISSRACLTCVRVLCTANKKNIKRSDFHHNMILTWSTPGPPPSSSLRLMMVASGAASSHARIPATIVGTTNDEPVQHM